MFAWLAGGERADASVPIAQWTAVLEHELRAEMNLRDDQSLGIEFIDLPSTVLPSEFDDELLLEVIFNFVSALRLPAAANRFLFTVNGASAQLVLVRRAPQRADTSTLVDVSTLTLERHTVRTKTALRSYQCRATSRRTGLLVLEHIVSSRWDLRQPSAAQCMAALLGDHFRPPTAQRVAAPLADRVAAERGELDALLAAAAREQAALGNGRAITGLCYLYLCDATNIAVCNDLIEEATRFAQRLGSRNGVEELARIAGSAPRYIPRLRGCSVTAPQLVAIVRDIARHLFGADVSAQTA
jgi:hypothetical protein